MKTQILKLNWKEFAKHLEALLQDTTGQISIPLQKQFELQVDFSSLDQQLSLAPDEHIEKVLFVFKKMNLYFESGLLLENNDQSYSVVSLFQKGHIRVAADDFHNQKIKLPKTQNFEVLTTSSQIFMKKLNLNWDPQNKLRAFLIQPTADFSFVLFSPVPDLWMQSEIPKLTKAMKRLFST
jgi:hypothetical protein